MILGDYYEGEWSDDMPHGFGKWVAYDRSQFRKAKTDKQTDEKVDLIEK